MSASVPIHGRNHRPGGPDPIGLTAAGTSPIGIFGGGSISPPDPAATSYLNWANANFGVIEEGSTGTFATVPAAAYAGDTYSSDRAGHPEIFCYIEEPGIYLCAIHVVFNRTGPASGVVHNYLQWSPGGYLDGGGGASYAEYQHETHDMSVFPNSYKGAANFFHRETVLYVRPGTTPAACNRYRAHSSAGYTTLAASGAVWKIGDWD